MSDQLAIIPFHADHRNAAIALVDRVFPSQGPIERLSLRVLGTRFEPLLRLGGIFAPRFWLAVRRTTVLGTVGLYQTEDGRPWLGWFCVDPEARGMGLGRRLLNFAISTAHADGHAILRLYTSTDPNELAAQHLYERMGFAETARYRPMSWRLLGLAPQLILRERHLSP